MSFRRMAAVFEVEGLCMRDKSVLLALAHFENEKTGRCFPSVRAIAKAAGCSARNVQYAIGALEQRGMISRVCKTDGVSATDYKINVPDTEGCKPCTRAESAPVQNLHHRGARFALGGAESAPQHRSNIEKNQEPSPSSEASHTARVHACARVREGTPAGAGLAAGVKLVPTFDEAIPDSTPPAWKPWRRIVGAARHSSRNLHVEGFDDLLAIAKDAGRDEAWLLDHLAVLAESGWRDYDGRREAVTIADRIDYLRAVIASEAAGEVVPPSE